VQGIVVRTAWRCHQRVVVKLGVGEHGGDPDASRVDLANEPERVGAAVPESV
jgi:hypothetical protein